MNVDLAVKVRTYIVTHPEEHRQHSWGRRVTNEDNSVTTTYCAAGTTCLVAGAEIVWHAGTYADFANHVLSESLPQHARSMNELTYTPDAARELLEIDRDRANELFQGTATTNETVALLDRWIQDEINNVAETM